MKSSLNIPKSMAYGGRGHTLARSFLMRVVQLMLVFLSASSLTVAQTLPASCTNATMLVSELGANNLNRLDAFKIGPTGATFTCAIPNLGGEGSISNPATGIAYIIKQATNDLVVYNYTTGVTSTSLHITNSDLLDVALSPDGAYVYIVGDTYVQKLSTATNTIVATMPTSAFTSATSYGAWGGAVNPITGNVYVSTNWYTTAGLPSQIKYVSPSLTGTPTTLVTAPTGLYFRGMQFDASGNLWVVASGAYTQADQLLEYNGTTGALLASYTFPTPTLNGITSGIAGAVVAFDLAWGPDGNLYIATMAGDCVTKFNVSTNTFSTYVPYAGSGYGAKGISFVCGDFHCTTEITARPDTKVTTVNTAVNIPVLPNDTYAGTTPTISNVQVTVTSQPANGTATVNADGTINFKPATGFTGVTTFNYQICEVASLTNCSTTTVSVTVVGVTATPDAANTPQNTPVNIPILANDTDNGSPATLTNVTLPVITTPPPASQGTAVVNADGTVTFTPANGYSGPASFTYTICDKAVPSVCSSTKVTVNVQCSKTTMILGDVILPGGSTGAVHVFTYGSTGATFNCQMPSTGGEGMGVNPSTSTVYISDVGANRLRVYNYLTGVTLATIALPSQGNGVKVSPDGQFVYVNLIATNQVLKISTATNSIVGTFTNLNGTNNGWGVDVNPTTGNVYVSMNSSSGSSIQYFSPTFTGGATTFATTTSGAFVGIVFDNAGNLWTVRNPSGSAAQLVKFDAATGAVLGTYSFPSPAVNGITGATGEVSPWDVAIGPDGNVYIATQKGDCVTKFDVTTNTFSTYVPYVAGVGGKTLAFICGDFACITAIVANPDSKTTTQNTAVNIPVLPNDTYAGTTPTTSQVQVTVTSQPANGTATVNSDGTINFKPATGFTGVTTFTYKICEAASLTNCASTTVSVTVVGVTANPESTTTTPGTPVNIPILSNDTDNGSPATTSNVTLPVITTPPSIGTAVVNSDGTVTYTPPPGYNGPVSFTYTICDKAVPTVCSSTKVTVNVQCSTYSILLGENGTVTKGTEILTYGSTSGIMKCSIPVGGEGVAVNPATNVAYIGSGLNLQVYNYATGTYVSNILLPYGILDVSKSSDGAYVYVSTYGGVYKISTATNAIVATFPLANFATGTKTLWGSAVNPTTGNVYVSTGWDVPTGGLSSIQYISPTLTGSATTLVTAPSGYYFRGIEFDASGNLWAVMYGYGPSALRDRLVEYNGTTGAVLATYDIPTPASYQTGVSAENGNINAWDLAFGPDGNLYITTYNGDCITKFNVTTNTFSTYVPYVAGGAGKSIAFVCGDIQCPSGLLGGTVWLDANKDGQLNGAETGVASVTATLYTSVNVPVSTTVTDASGNYQFTGLPAGSYYVKFTTPTGYTYTTANVGNDATDSDVASTTGTSGATGVYSLTAGQANLTVYAGIIPVVTTTPDATTTTPGTAVNISILSNDTDNGSPATTSNVTLPVITTPPAIGTAVVNADGTVTYTPPPGYSGPVSFTYTICDKAVPTVCSSTSVTVQVQCSTYSILVGEFGMNPDGTGNGTASTEILTYGSSGATMKCSIPGGGEGMASNTNTNIVYILSAASPIIQVYNYATGIVQSTISLPNSPTPAQGLDASLSPDMAYLYVSSYNGVYKISTATNTIVASMPASTFTSATDHQLWGNAVNPITGNVYVTTNWNATPLASQIMYVSPSLTGSPTVLVTAPSGLKYVGIVFDASGNLWALLRGNGSNPDRVIKYNGTTGAQLGSYDMPLPSAHRSNAVVGNLGPYDIGVGPDGNIYITTFNGDCITKFDVTTNSFSTYVPFVATSAAKSIAFVCGDVACPGAALGGKVWLDANKDGQLNGTETGVGSVTATLYNATTGLPISVTTTDANGNYLFTTLPAGSYYVKFTTPTGYTYTTANTGADATDSDVSSVAGTVGTTGPVTLSANQVDQTVYAGIFPVVTTTPDAATTTPGTLVTIPVLNNDTDMGNPATTNNVTLPVITVPPSVGTASVNPDGTISYTPPAGYSGPVSFTYSICDKAVPTVCSSTSVTVQVQLLCSSAIPTLSASVKSNVCPATTVDLSGITASNTPVGYLLGWFSGTPATAANRVANPTMVAAGTYYAAFYNAATGCYGPTSSPVTAFVNSCTLIQVSNVCPANTVNLATAFSAADLPAGAVVTWHSGTPATDANRLTSTTAVGAGTYYAAYYDATNGGCYSPTTGVQVSISACIPCTPLIPGQVIPATASVMVGGSASFTYVGQTPGSSVRWFVSPSNTVSPNQGTGTVIPSISFLNAGYYQIVFEETNSTVPAGCTTPSTVQSTLDYLVKSPTPICAYPGSSTVVTLPTVAAVKIGQQGSFSLVGGQPYNNVQWEIFPPSGATPNTGSGAFTNNIVFSQEGLYRAVFTMTNLGDGTCTPVQKVSAGLISVGLDPCAAPSPIDVVEASGKDSTLVGTTATFNAVGGVPRQSMIWKVYPTTGVSSVSGTGSTATLTFSQVGNYVVTFIATNGSLPLNCTKPTATAGNYPIKVYSLAPVATPDIANTNPGVPVPGNVLTNDSDPQGLPLTTTLLTQPPVGTVTLTPTGNFTYTPPATFTGTVNFCYQATNTLGISSSACVTVNVIPQPVTGNNPPVANNDATQTTMGTPVKIVILANDSDPDSNTSGNGQLNTPTLLGQPAQGTASVNPDGSVTYTPPAGFVGVVTFPYQVCDKGTPVLCTTAVVTVNVQPTPPAGTTLAPVAVDDALLTSINTPKSGNVAPNDSDPNSPALPLTFSGGQPSHGTVVLNPDGSYTYTPTTGYTGPDSFTYQACNSAGKCDKATVSIDVLPLPANQTPMVTPDVNTFIPGTPTAGNVLTNDKDPEGQPLTATPVGSVPPGFVMTPNGSYTYTPPVSQTSPVTVTYQACDAATPPACATTTLTLTPVTPPSSVTNDAPIALNDATRTTAGVPVKVPVLGNDKDPEGQPLSNPTLLGQPAQGTASVNPDGTITYTPPAGFTGVVTFPYQVCDTGTPVLCATAVVTVNVDPTPPASQTNLPPVAIDDNTLTQKNTPVTATVASNDSDPNTGQTLTFTKLSNPANGTVQFNPDGTFTYTPPTGFVGTTNFVYQVCDNGTPVLCTTATAYITISDPVNNAPQVTPDVNTFIPGTPTAGNVLTNDKDPEGQPLTATPVGSVPPGFVMTPNGSYTYTPPASQTSPVTVTYQACDAATPPACATTTLTLTPVTPPSSVTNDAPIALNDASRTTAGVPVKVPVLGNDKDPEGQPLSNPTLLGQPTQGTASVNPDGTITYTPPAGFTGVVTFPYQVCDTGTPVLCATAVVTVNVDPTPPASQTNLPPVAIDDNTLTQKNTPVTATVASNDSDPNVGQTLTFTKLSNPANGTVQFNPDGSFTYTPPTGFVGTTNFVYQVCDNGTPVLCTTATAYITVSDPVNQTPMVTPDVNTFIPGTPTAGNVLTNDKDPEGQPLTATPVGSVPPGFVMTPNGSYTYTPPASQTSPVTVTYQACDAATPPACATTTLTLTPVTPPSSVTNDAPIALNDATRTTAGVPVKVPVLGNDKDPEGQPLSNPTLLGQPTQGTASVNPDGTITYTPPAGFTGVVTFPYQVCDTGTPVLCATAVVTVTVDPTPPASQTNLPPVAIDDNTLTQKNTPVTATVASNDSDPNTGQTLTFTKLSNPANGTVQFNPDGSFTYTPPTGFVGTTNFIYQVCDNGTPVLCTTATAYITVSDPVNQTPMVTPDVNTFIPGTPTAGNVLTNDKDPEGQPLTATPVGSVPPGFVMTPNGSYTYTPPASQTSPVTVTYQACDAATPPACATTTLTLTPVTPPSSVTNDAPIALNDATRTTAGTPVKIPVLGNDKDPEGQPLSNPTLLGQPAQGTASVNPDGTITYTPPAGFTGVVTFPYQVCDTGTPVLCATAVVTVTVDPTPPASQTNLPPVAIDDNTLTQKNTPVTATVASNDSDPNTGQTLTFTKLSNPANGTVQFNPDGSFTYTPPTGFVGTTNFVYQVCDNGTPVLCTTATAYITVSDPCASPIPAPLITPQSATICTTGSLTLTAIGLPNATYSWTGSSLAAPVSGPMLVLTNLPAGTYSYSVVQILSSCTSVAASTTVLSTPAACTYKAPIATPDIANTNPGVPVPGNVLTNDSDPQGLPLTTTLISQPPVGTVTLTPTGAYTYTPPVGFTGTVNFCYQAMNTAGLSSSACVTVNVIAPLTPGNNPPVANNDATQTTMGTPVKIVILANDTDPDSNTSGNGQLNTPTLLGQPSQGSVSLNPDGSVTYTPPAGFTGTVSFPYQVCDKGTPVLCATAVVTVNILPTPPAGTTLAPVAVDDALLTSANTPKSGNVATNDSDPQGLPLTFSSGQPSHGTVVMNPDGSYTYTPTPGYTGPDSFTYQACNSAGLCDKATVSVDVVPLPPSPPVLVGEPIVTKQGVPVTVCMPIVDKDQPDSFTASICGQPAGGPATATANNQTRQVCVTYTPTATFTGPTTVCVQVCDSQGNCTQVIVPIEVVPSSPTAVTPAPPVVVVTPVVTPKDTPATVCMPIVDPNVSDTHSVSICGTPTKGTATAVVNNSTHEVCITYTPTAGQTGNDQVCITVCDNTGLCTQVLVPVSIVDPTPPGPGLEPPVVVPPVIVTTPNTPVVVCTGITDSITDVHSASICAAPGNGSAQLAVDNTNHTLCITYTPGSQPGNTSLCVTVCDQTGQCTNVIVPITVLPPAIGPCQAIDLSGISVSIPNGGVITAGESAAFTLNGANAAYQVSWFITPTVDVTPATSGTGLTTGNLTFAQPGDYMVWYKLVNSSLPAGCTTPAEALVKGQLLVNPSGTNPCPSPSSVSVSASPTGSLSVGQMATFTMQGGSPNTSVSWSVYPATGASPSTGTGSVANVSFSQRGSYVITFVALNAPAGCTPARRSASTSVYVREAGAGGGDCTTPTPVLITPSSVSAQTGSSVTFTASGGVPGQLTWSIIPAASATPFSGTGPVAMTTFTNPGTYIITYTSTNSGSPAGCTLPASTATSLAYLVQNGNSMVSLKLKVLLQGALMNSTGGLMRDDLRSGGYLPMREPYTAIGGPRFVHVGGGGGETMPASVTAANVGTGDAIVDWVFVELRDPANLSAVVATRSALVQRDGDVVLASDGVSPLSFNSLASNSYYVSVKHRNHLGVMTAAAIPLSVTGTVVDFTTMSDASVWNMSGPLAYDGAERVTMAEAGGRKALWAGNAYNDSKEHPGLWPDRVKYQGPDNDLLKVFSEVLNYPTNTNQTYNFDFGFGYWFGDVNMDGKVKYQGPANDSNIIFINVIDTYPLNTAKLYNFDLFYEQLP